MSKEKRKTEDEGATMTLLLREVPREILDGIEQLGAGMRPPVRRNDLILHLLREAAEHRITLDCRAAS